MRIVQTHSRAIYMEIGERMRASRSQLERPTSLEIQLDRFRELDGESPSIVPSMD